MMKIARLLCVLWVCGSPALEARAAESPAHNAASMAPNINAGRSAAQESTQARSSKGDGSKGRDAAAAASPRRGSVATAHTARSLARSNADRPRSLHPTKALGYVAPAPNRRVAPKAGTASGNMSARGQAPTPRAAASAARVPRSVTAMVRGSAIGGLRAPAGSGQLGGPARGRTAHNAAIDGTQLHRKM